MLSDIGEVGARNREVRFTPGGLNRLMQHFILEGKDGVGDGTKIS
jgi:hypothetical protein